MWRSEKPTPHLVGTRSDVRAVLDAAAILGCRDCLVNGKEVLSGQSVQRIGVRPLLND